MRQTYRQPEWALFLQPGDGTGAACRRHADAVAMSMYPSRGLTIRGFEFKISRSDFKREKDNPEKAEAVAQYCDEWFIVAPKGLIKSYEVPGAWGFIEFADGKLRQVNKATRQQSPQPLNRHFVASLLRARCKEDEGYIQKLVREGVKAERANDEQKIEAQIERRTTHASKVLDRHKVFAEFLRHPDFEYSDEETFLNAIKIAMHLNMGGYYGNLKRMQELGDSFHKVVEDFKALGITATERKVKKK